VKALLCLAALLLPSAASAVSSGTLRGLDVYRSTKLSTEQAQETYGPRLTLYTELADSKKTKAGADRLRKELIESVRKLGDFAYVDLHISRYVTSADNSTYATFDLVDADDASQRMPFMAAPSGRVPEIDDLSRAWEDYLATGLEQRRTGKISYDRPACPAYYCLYGGSPELAAFERTFVEAAAKNRPMLLKAAREEADPKKRAAAVYLLSYSLEGKATADTILGFLQDADVLVRSAALEVISDMAIHHRDVFVDVVRVLPALDYPSTNERVKAMGVLIGLSDHPDARPYIITRATPRLIELLKQQQPSVHDLAYTLLALLSKESFGRRDYGAWTSWATKQAPKMK
jgi:hypothetical protein